MTRCPHADIRFCPLYIASHIAGAGGCDDGYLESGGCGIDRGVNYSKALAQLNETHFSLVAGAEFSERQHAKKSQQARNMRAAGIH